MEQGHVEWNKDMLNGTLVLQSTVLQIFGAATCSGMAILDACRMASLATGFNQRVVHRWAKDVYVDFFSTLSSLEDVTESLSKALFITARCSSIGPMKSICGPYSVLAARRLRIIFLKSIDALPYSCG